MLLVPGLSSGLRKNWKDCDSHGGTLTGQVHEPGVRENIIPGHDQKVLQELSSLSCQCLDKRRPWLWFPRRAAPKVHLPQSRDSKPNSTMERKLTLITHTETRANTPVNTQGRAMAWQHLPG